MSVAEFGTGHSSLMALSRYAGIGELKLDSGLVSNVLAEPTSTASPAPSSARRTRSGARRRRGGRVGQIVAHLRELGCDVLQGYFIRPPAPLPEIREMGRGVPVTARRPVRHGVSEVS